MRLFKRRFLFVMKKGNFMIKLYNTKSNKIEEFKPIRENEVSMYVCGPTVYNHAHIGNARPLIVFDKLLSVVFLQRDQLHLCFLHCSTSCPAPEQKIPAMPITSYRAHPTPYLIGGLRTSVHDPLCYGTLSSGDQLYS
jgi:hypothetical protein